MRTPVTTLLASISALIATLSFNSVRADPYRWCAEYSGGSHGGSTSCYFMSYEQCRASVSGVGGFCRENGFYDGLPVRTPEDGPAPRRKSRSGR